MAMMMETTMIMTAVSYTITMVYVRL